MGTVGAAVGTVDAQITIKKCLNSENCFIANMAEKRINRVANGIYAGMVVASFLSFPAIFSDS
ncbi:hypothetical protein IQ255_07455 [Pleurocapsales cyanobacterium LEGE 10410]|nr:hypothetical protein [Pleurocapsales cyanobacterium LEGE 10410]